MKIIHQTLITITVFTWITWAALPSVAHCVTIMKIGDNIFPSPTFPGTANTGAFTIGAEFRMISVTGSIGGGSPLNKDFFNGHEEWHFNDDGILINVVNTPMTLGAHEGSGSGLGESAAPDGDLAIGSGSLLFFAPINFLAPYVGSDAANAYGPARLTILSDVTFTVHFPVLELQWYDSFMLPGLASGGVTFRCSGQPSTDFHCTGEEQIDRAEDLLGLGFVGWTLQWEFGSDIPTESGLAINMWAVGGQLQECSSAQGSEVQLQSDVIVQGDLELESLTWTIGEKVIGTGPSITTPFDFGTHTIELTAIANNGNATSKTTTVIVRDTTAPNVEPYFMDARSDAPISNLTQRLVIAQNQFNVSDACDPNPKVSANLGVPTDDKDYLFIRKDRGGMVRLYTEELNLMVTAKDAAGNTGVGETKFVIEPTLRGQ